jgi:hypothetical protein
MESNTQEQLGTIKKIDNLFDPNIISILSKLPSYIPNGLHFKNVIFASQYMNNIKQIIQKLEDILKEEEEIVITSGFICKEISDELNLNLEDNITSFSYIKGYKNSNKEVFEIRIERE